MKVVVSISIKRLRICPSLLQTMHHSQTISQLSIPQPKVANDVSDLTYVVTKDKVKGKMYNWVGKFYLIPACSRSDEFLLHQFWLHSPRVCPHEHSMSEPLWRADARTSKSWSNETRFLARASTAMSLPRSIYAGSGFTPSRILM